MTYFSYSLGRGGGEPTLDSAFVQDVVLGSNGSLTVLTGSAIAFLMGATVFFLTLFSQGRLSLLVFVHSRGPPQLRLPEWEIEKNQWQNRSRECFLSPTSSQCG